MKIGQLGFMYPMIKVTAAALNRNLSVLPLNFMNVLSILSANLA